MLGIYRKLAEDYLAIPVLTGRKSDSEKFAGAVRTYAIEMLMPDGKALQAGTSHNLGQNFAKAFNIRYESKEQKLEYAWQTSWGATTRLVGALVMTHGDDSGLILPPRVAPIQAVIVPISAGNWQETVLPQAQKIFAELKGKGLRVHLDDRDAYTPGWKYADWEMRGVPVRIEIGPKDIEKQQVVLVSRLDRKKSFVPWSSLAEELSRLLERIQGELYSRALAFRDANTRAGEHLRRAPGSHGRQPRLHPLRLVRQPRLRGQGQGRHLGHHPRHPGRARSALAGHASSARKKRCIRWFLPNPTEHER